MAKFIKGEVVIFPFPFSDLSNTKRRPALVLATLKGDDLICCQITSQNNEDTYCVTLIEEDFSIGSLPTSSMIRPNRIFTVDRRIILRSAGMVSKNKLEEVIQKLVDILK